MTLNTARHLLNRAEFDAKQAEKPAINPIQAAWDAEIAANRAHEAETAALRAQIAARYAENPAFQAFQAGQREDDWAHLPATLLDWLNQA